MTCFKLRPALCAGALAILAACGGTTVPLGTTPVPTNDRLSLSEIRQVQRGIKPGYDAAGFTPKFQLPTTGGADYLGYVQGDLTVPGKRTDVSGLMQMGVDFGRNSVGGTVGNLVTAQGAPLDGTLRLRNGVLDRRQNANQATIRAGVDGTLRSGAGEIISLDGAVTNGGFKGPNGAFAGVPMNGAIRVDDGRTVERGSFGLTGILSRQ